MFDLFILLGVLFIFLATTSWRVRYALIIL